MGVTKIENKDYRIIRRGFGSFWKFWQIDELEFTLPTQYSDAYEEVEKKLINGNEWSIVLSSWVIEDIREQLASRVSTYDKLVKKAKKLMVVFSTSESGQRFIDRMNFYVIDGGIYFDVDDAIKRQKLLNKLGI